LIVGAGPTGLTLACDLARRNVACRVIDRAEQPFAGSRGKGLQQRTLEVFDDLGVLDAIFAGGAPFPPFRLYAGTQLVWERSLEQMLGAAATALPPGAPYVRPWLIPQWRTDAILARRFEALGGRVEHGTALTGFEQDEDGVTATLTRAGDTESLRTEYLVGADGGHSFVRQALGVAFEGTTLDVERTLIGDVGVSGLDGIACHLLTAAGDPSRRFSLWNLPGTDLYQFVVSLAADEAPELSLAALQRLLEQRSGRVDIRLHDLRWASIYRVNARLAERFRVGRVLLAGDAAHVHSSAGGQGLNTSVQDAYNLGWKLAAALHGADPSLLDSYEAERWPVAARVLGATALMHHRGFRAPEPTEPQPALHQLDIHYRDSPLAIDDRPHPGRLRAGDRAPDARLPDGRRLFDVFRGPHFTLLALGIHASNPVPMGSTRPLIIETAEPIDGYDIEPGHFVLVRPDGHIGIITPSEASLKAYLDKLGGLARRTPRPPG
jgi:2-polyprenyl-6-methoxyphenol hydroxylase-like FAD-dependent oxidoreductase